MTGCDLENVHFFSSRVYTLVLISMRFDFNEVLYYTYKSVPKELCESGKSVKRQPCIAAVLMQLYYGAALPRRDAGLGKC